MSFSMDETQVTVTLTGVKRGDTKPNFKERKFNLTPRAMIMPIGRSSKRHAQRGDPGTDNAFFDSPVISRKHAELFLVPSTKYVHIRDLGSLHGTIVNNTNLASEEEMDLRNGDIVTIGSDIAHKDKSYQAQTFQISYERHPYVESENTIPSDVVEDDPNSSDETNLIPQIDGRATSFSVPEFGSSDSDYYDSEQGEEDEDIDLQEDLAWLQNDIHVQQSATPVIPALNASNAIGTFDHSPPFERLGSSHQDPLIIDDDITRSRPAFIDLTEERRSGNDTVIFNSTRVDDSDSDSASVIVAGEHDLSPTSPSVPEAPLLDPVSQKLSSASVPKLTSSNLGSPKSHLDASPPKKILAEQIEPAKPTLPSVRAALKDILDLPEPVNGKCSDVAVIRNNSELDKQLDDEGTNDMEYETELSSEDEICPSHPNRAKSVVCAKSVAEPDEAMDSTVLQHKSLCEWQMHLMLFEQQHKRRLSMVEAEAKVQPQEQGSQRLAKGLVETLNVRSKRNISDSASKRFVNNDSNVDNFEGLEKDIEKMKRPRAPTTTSDKTVSTKSAAPIQNYSKVPIHTCSSREDPSRPTTLSLPSLQANSDIHPTEPRLWPTGDRSSQAHLNDFKMGSSTTRWSHGDIPSQPQSADFDMAPSTTKSVSFANEDTYITPVRKQPPLNYGRSLLSAFDQPTSTHESFQRHWNDGKPFAMYDKHFQSPAQLSCPPSDCQSTRYSGGQPNSNYCSPYVSSTPSSLWDFRKPVDLSPYEYHPYYPVHGISKQSHARCSRPSATLPYSNTTLAATLKSGGPATMNYSMNEYSDVLHDRCGTDPYPDIEDSRSRLSGAETAYSNPLLRTSISSKPSAATTVKSTVPTASSKQSITSLNRLSNPSIVEQPAETDSIAGTKRKANQISSCSLKSMEFMKTGNNSLADAVKYQNEVMKTVHQSDKANEPATIADQLTVKAAHPIVKTSHPAAKTFVVASTNQLTAASRAISAETLAVPLANAQKDRQPARKRAKLTSRAAPFLVGALAGGVAVLGALVTLPESFF